VSGCWLSCSGLSYKCPQHRYIVAASLLSLCVHAVVLLFLYMRPSPAVSIQQNTVNVYFDHMSAGAEARSKTQATTQRILTKADEPAAEKPIQPTLETSSQTTPVRPDESVVSSQNISTPSGKVESISSLSRIPSPLRKIEAAYPPSERRAGIQASVLVEVVIDAQGKVQDVHILKSGGIAFDTSVIEAMKKSAFTPGYIGDKAVPVRISIPFRFNLN